TVFQLSLIESRSYLFISPSTAFQPVVVTRISCRDSVSGPGKDGFVRAESTLIIKPAMKNRRAKKEYRGRKRLNLRRFSLFRPLCPFCFLLSFLLKKLTLEAHFVITSRHQTMRRVSLFRFCRMDRQDALIFQNSFY